MLKVWSGLVVWILGVDQALGERTCAPKDGKYGLRMVAVHLLGSVAPSGRLRPRREDMMVSMGWG